MCGQYTKIYFPEKGVRFISVNDNVDTINNTGSMDITPFKHILNDMYAKDISTKIKSLLHMKAMRGEYLGALDPYGYVRDPKDKYKLLVNEETAPIVKRIFEMCAGGMGSRSIATTLNNEGVLPPQSTTDLKTTTQRKTGLLSVNATGVRHISEPCSKMRCLSGAWCRADSTHRPTAQKSG